MKQQYSILLFNPYLAETIGLNEAIILQQILYWKKKSSAREWIYNSYKDWQKQFRFWSLRTIQRAFSSLEKQGFLRSKRTKTCKFYSVRLETIKKFLPDQDMSYCHLGYDKLAHPINIETENNTEDNSLSSLSTKTLYSIPKREKCDKDLKNLIDLWERKIPSSGQPLTLSDTRKRKLGTIFLEVFNSDIKKWESFIDQISNSDFLMGKVTKFKIFLDWAIKKENCIKILEGSYINQKSSSSTPQEYQINLKEKTDESIKSISNPDWKKASQILVDIVGIGEYSAWFKDIKFDKCQNNRIYLQTESNFKRDWINNKHIRAIKEAWAKATCFNVDNITITSRQYATSC